MSGTRGSDSSAPLSDREVLIIGAGLVGGAAAATVAAIITGDALVWGLFPGAGIFLALLYIAVSRRRAQ